MSATHRATTKLETVRARIDGRRRTVAHDDQGTSAHAHRRYDLGELDVDTWAFANPDGTVTTDVHAWVHHDAGVDVDEARAFASPSGPVGITVAGHDEDNGRVAVSASMPLDVARELRVHLDRAIAELEEEES